MARRLVRWFTFGVMFALIPLLWSLLIRYFTGKLTFAAAAESPEILFFSLMVDATSLADLNDVARPRTKRDLVDLMRDILWAALLLGAVFSAIFYGVFLMATLGTTIGENFLYRIFSFSMVLAIVSFCLTTVTQVFLGRIGK